MDDVIEIDLRKLILSLLARWQWIIGIAFLFGLAAFLYSFLQPDIYRARAVIAITKPRYVANFDPQYQTVNTGLPSSKAVLDVVTSDDVVESVYAQWENERKQEISYDNFRDNVLDAAEGNDPSIIFLNVRLKDPEQAAWLANRWAEISIRKVNALFSGMDENQVIFFDSQIVITEANLMSAETALVEFEERDRTAVLNNELNALLARQTENLRKQRVLREALQDAQGIMQLLGDRPAGEPVSSQVLTNFQVIQLRVYADAVTGETQNNPLQLQIGGTNQAETVTTADFLQNANAWAAVIEEQIEDLIERQSEIESGVAAYQRELRLLQNEKQNLELNYQVVKETYETLLRKQKEARISANENSGEAQLASNANVPTERLSHNTVRNTAIGIAVGGILVVLSVILWDWFKQESDEVS